MRHAQYYIKQQDRDPEEWEKSGLVYREKHDYGLLKTAVTIIYAYLQRKYITFDA